MVKIGIMQGRLLPPENNRIQAFPARDWQKEFPLAGRLGLDCIEFIFDGDNYAQHPLITEKGIREIRDLTKKTGVCVYSVCADLFMRYPIHRGSITEKTLRVRLLQDLIQNCAGLDVSDIVLPCVDDSQIKNDTEMKEFTARLSECLPVAEEYGINLTLETDLAPEPFSHLMHELHHDNLKINYDTGNSASLGYDPDAEFAAYGRWITDIHIKDRIYGGTTVPLGTGSVDFDRVFSLLRRMDYQGIVILQTARGESGRELDTIKAYLDFIGKYLP